MIPKNISRERCLVCCPENMFTPEHAAILISLGYEVSVATSRDRALREFMAIKPSLFIAYRTFLPTFPHRLIQLFKIAHCVPAMLLMAENTTLVWRYLHLKNETSVEFLESPLRAEDLALCIKLATQRLKSTRRKLFIKDLVLQSAMALPVFLFLIYLITR